MPRWSDFEPYFWSLVDKTGECWLWLGGFDGKGYGRIWRDGRRQGAHRVAYELEVGPIPPGLFACHHCDNKKCVNPRHIFIGTGKDNMQDWTRKGFNRLANDRSLWSQGRHWKTKEGSKEKLAATRRAEFASGQRQVVRDEKGRIVGTRMVSR